MGSFVLGLFELSLHSVSFCDIITRIKLSFDPEYCQLPLLGEQKEQRLCCCTLSDSRILKRVSFKRFKMLILLLNSDYRNCEESSENANLNLKNPTNDCMHFYSSPPPLISTNYDLLFVCLTTFKPCGNNITIQFFIKNPCYQFFVKSVFWWINHLYLWPAHL